MKQNERVLSSQALNVGRSLGVNSNMEKFTFQSDVQGYHVWRDVWKPPIGEILHAQQELDNAIDKFTVKMVKNNETVGRLLCEYSWIFSYLIARGRKNCKQLCGGMGIPCRLVLSSSISWRARLADKHSKTQTAPMGATTHEKVNEQQQHVHAKSFFYVYFLTSWEVVWILIRLLWIKVRLIHGRLQ